MERLFPRVVNNTYTGNKIPLYFLYLLCAVTIGRSLAHMFLADGGAQSIATIPLDSYSTEAAGAVIHIFAEWGLSQLLFGLLYVIVLSKYNSLVPLMFLFMCVEYSGRLLLTVIKPMELAGTAPGGILNYVMIPLTLLMLFLALQQATPNRS